MTGSRLFRADDRTENAVDKTALINRVFLGKLDRLIDRHAVGNTLEIENLIDRQSQNSKRRTGNTSQRPAFFEIFRNFRVDFLLPCLDARHDRLRIAANAAAKQLGLNEYVVKLAYQSVSDVTEKRVFRFLDACYEADKKLKTTSSDAWGTLTQLVCSI